jgi:hypothetical protein
MFDITQAATRTHRGSLPEVLSDVTPPVRVYGAPLAHWAGGAFTMPGRALAYWTGVSEKESVARTAGP